MNLENYNMKNLRNCKKKLIINKEAKIERGRREEENWNVGAWKKGIREALKSVAIKELSRFLSREKNG